MARKGKEDILATKSICPGESVYGEKKVQVEVSRLHLRGSVWCPRTQPFCRLLAVNGDFRIMHRTHTRRQLFQTDGEKIEYRMWNPFRSKIAAAVLGGVSSIHMAPGSKVLYLGAASGTTVSHIADIVGPVRLCPAL